MKKHIIYLTTAAIIAAAYVALTAVSAAFGLAYGPIQFRLSEVLCILPVFTPAAIPGLTIGCIISNTFSFNLIDMLFGSLATLTAAVITYLTKNITVFKLPIISFISPIIVNAVIVGMELSVFFLPDTAFWQGFLLCFAQVALGQAVVCLVLGIPFYKICQKIKIFK